MTLFTHVSRHPKPYDRKKYILGKTVLEMLYQICAKLVYWATKYFNKKEQKLTKLKTKKP